MGDRNWVATRRLWHPFASADEASIIYKATGNLGAIQILLGHTRIENTVRHLGVDIEDALELAEHTEI
jgi:site-specific recombinase XerC